MSGTPDPLIDVAKSLLSRLQIPPAQVESLAQQALSLDYWRTLNPQLGVAAAASRQVEAATVPLQQVDDCVAAIAREGYFQLHHLLAPDVAKQMRAAMENLCAHDWLPVFAFMYDEFWQMTRGAAVTHLLTGALGEGYMQRPGVWAHRVQPVRGAAGWLPHVDSYGKKGTPGHLALWFPLSDATLENGCMYVIPRDLIDPEIAERFSELKTVAATELRLLLQRARALPAAAGTLLGWDFNVIHWGSTALGGGEPRLSVAIEFVSRKDAGLDPRTVPFSVDGNLPTFAERARMVAASIVEYSRHETLVKRFVPVAERMLKEVAVGAEASR